MLSLSKREELFFILSTKLEKEDAELLERKISTFIIELDNSRIDKDIENCNELLSGGFKYYDIGNKGSLGKISLEGFSNGIRRWRDLFQHRRSSNKDNLIEILK